ncbi:serine/threonine-protein kinase [Actinocorallia populi]|uniref:serine/threonine-protein kinase n=1 Tax=Actinocorallia populi TaxID=2079200 RepID=UPI001E293A1F|nr:serine/threonine-protein kinase [Actinocorallia populi]
MEQNIGPYRLMNRLGRGGMGTVYLAQDGEGRQVALKVINAELADEPVFRERFRREVVAAQRVRRFCTASVLDADLENDPLYVVTEYVQGPTLDEHIQASGPMRGSSLEHLAVGVATALAAIHGAGIVHRDLKPANVLLSPVGPRVIDFGIARALDTVAAATRTGTFVGTPAYMAPEVIRGEGATPAADIWAWGCVVAFAGTGVAPFSAANIPAILYQVTQGTPNLEGLDEGVRKLVETALAPDPQARPTAQQLLDQLTGQTRVDVAQVARTVQSESPFSPERGFTHAPPPPPVETTAAMRSENGGSRRRVPGNRRHLLIGAGVAVAATLVGTTFVYMSGEDGPPEAATVFDDAFADTGTGWTGNNFIPGVSNYGYFQGRYRLVVTSEYSLSDEVGSPYKNDRKEWRIPSRALVSVTVTMSGTPSASAGLSCFGPESHKEGYRFLVRADGQGVVVRRVTKDRGNAEIGSRKEAAGFSPGKANRLQIACEKQGTATRLRLWINGTPALEETDADGALTEGTAGLLIEQTAWDGKGLTADFDDFQIAEIR